MGTPVLRRGTSDEVTTMSDEWTPGDVAICVDDKIYGPSGGRTWGLQKGKTYTVVAVNYSNEYSYNPRGLCKQGLELVLLEVKNPYSDAFCALRFKKEQPLVTEDERETIRDLEDTLLCLIN